jgi:hypothetical protein
MAFVREGLAPILARLEALEAARDTFRAEAPSHHDWTAQLQEMDRILAARVRDPHDRLTSDRARAIAADVVERAKDKEGAHELDDVKSRKRDRWDRLTIHVVEGIVMLVIGALAAKIGWH